MHSDLTQLSVRAKSIVKKGALGARVSTRVHAYQSRNRTHKTHSALKLRTSIVQCSISTALTRADAPALYHLLLADADFRHALSHVDALNTFSAELKNVTHTLRLIVKNQKTKRVKTNFVF